MARERHLNSGTIVQGAVRAADLPSPILSAAATLLPPVRSRSRRHAVDDLLRDRLRAGGEPLEQTLGNTAEPLMARC